MITTKSGDLGVSHWNNQSVHKDDILIETIGCIDELQAMIGYTGAEVPEVMVDLWGIMPSEKSQETRRERQIQD